MKTFNIKILNNLETFDRDKISNVEVLMGETLTDEKISKKMRLNFIKDIKHKISLIEKEISKGDK